MKNLRLGPVESLFVCFGGSFFISADQAIHEGTRSEAWKLKIFWSAEETSTHQDHVIAHVIGTSVLGYFVLDESLHMLLDIGFIWTIYLDGQMVLLPQTAAVSELEVEASVRSELSREIEQLERDGRGVEALQHLTAAPVECVIKEVNFFACDEKRRLVLVGETANLIVETSLDTGQIKIKEGKG